MPYLFFFAFALCVITHSVVMRQIKNYMALKYPGLWQEIRLSANPQRQAVEWVLAGRYRGLADKPLNTIARFATLSFYAGLIFLLCMCLSLAMQ